MNSYEQKIENKKARFAGLSAAAGSASDVLYSRAKSMASVNPFGQPILVGHHSEGRDRAYRGRITSTFSKSFALADKAAYYAGKAESVGTGGVSSDDPDAVVKLKTKLDGLIANQEAMKAANKIKRVSHPSYQLSNNNANIAATKKRIEELEAIKSRGSQEVEGVGWRCVVDPDEELRVNFYFDGKPSDDVRSLLKSSGFKWSPSRGAWTRKATGNGNYAARNVIEKLKNKESKNA